MDFHGGNVYKIFREKNITEILDYSSNINPYGVPESLKQKIIENLNPDIVLKRGYAIIHGQLSENAIVHLETETHQAEAKIIKVKNKE